MLCGAVNSAAEFAAYLYLITLNLPPMMKLLSYEKDVRLFPPHQSAALVSNPLHPQPLCHSARVNRVCLCVCARTLHTSVCVPV